MLTSLILLSQVGLPMHYHYCKGALESVSILFRNNCNDELAVAKVPDCCKKYMQNHCKKENNGCCHDKVKVLNQDLTSLLPVFYQWSTLEMEITNPIILTPASESIAVSSSGFQHSGDSGPPIYIRFHSLIFYA
jgi:hypothetical protein